MIGIPSPRLAMIPKPQTLTLILPLLFYTVSSVSLPGPPSPSPSPSPSALKSLMSDPIGALHHSPPLPETFRRRSSPPPPLSCASDRIDCLEKHRGRGRSGGGPPPAKDSLNFGKKIGIVFAVAAILLQVVLGGFLLYKKRQLRKLDQRGSRLSSGSHSS